MHGSYIAISQQHTSKPSARATTNLNQINLQMKRAHITVLRYLHSSRHRPTTNLNSFANEFLKIFKVDSFKGKVQSGSISWRITQHEDTGLNLNVSQK